MMSNIRKLEQSYNIRKLLEKYRCYNKYADWYLNLECRSILDKNDTNMKFELARMNFTLTN